MSSLPYLYGITFLLWDILFLFFNAHGYGKRIHGGSLGDSLKDAAVSYLVRDQILTMLTFLSKKTKKISSQPTVCVLCTKWPLPSNG